MTINSANMSLHNYTSYAKDNIIKSLLLVVAGTWLTSQLVKLMYNLFFHPLSHIPGPRLAAATYIPEFYYDVLRSGRYTERIRHMHETYGKIPLTSWLNSTEILTCVKVPLSALTLTKSTAAIISL